MNILVLSRLKTDEINKLEKSFPDFSFTYSKEKEVTQTMIDNCDILVGNPGKHVELNRPNLKAILLNSAGSDYYIQEGVLHAQHVLPMLAAVMVKQSLNILSE